MESHVCSWISLRNLVARIDVMTNRIDNNFLVICTMIMENVPNLEWIKRENYFVRNMYEVHIMNIIVVW